MPRLLHDRYLEITGAQACDLATGEVVTMARVGDRRAAREPSPPTLLEVLDHGRDGQPRYVRMEMRPGTRWMAAVDRVAGDAVEHGYVPVDVGQYERLLLLAADDLCHRTLLLIAGERDAGSARRALIDAAVRTPRPHVLVILRTAAGTVQPTVQEARAVYATSPRIRPPAALAPDVVQHIARGLRATDFIAEGRHAAAERLLRDVGAALRRRSADAAAATAYISLGRMLLERGRPADAGSAFADAAAAAAVAQDEVLEATTRLWQATARTDAAQLTAAESIARAVLLVGALTDPQRAWAHAVLARVLLWQDRVREAAALLAGLPSRLPDGDLDPDTAAFVTATRARVQLARGDIFDAGITARALLERVGAGATAARIAALTSRLRVLGAAGDLVGAEACLGETAAVAAQARTPLRLVRARLVWLDMLVRAGRSREAGQECRWLARVGRAAPPLLHRAIERRLRAETSRHDATTPLPRGDAWSATALIRSAQDDEDDGAAVRRVVAAAVSRADATRVDVWSADAGPATIIDSVGTGLRSTIGPRVLEAGIVIGPDGVDPPRQLGVPVRLGARLIGALVARWPADRVPPGDVQPALELVAAVVAPRLDGLLHRARTTAQAALVIPELVGVSQAITEVRQAVVRAAAAPFAVLVEGESGVGKELIARAVHHLSPRRERRFCDVNCAALPDELLESELFGHARGAFTGAVADRAGLFEDAHGGTLFLDEIADLSARAQAKLLRVLQQQEIRRVGETFARPIDVRLVAAANRDMRTEAASGRFRQDLLYRIDVIRIPVPALRERPEDIPLLAHHFWRDAGERVGTAATLTPALVAALAGYHWPGNVRELQNVIAALAVAAPPRGRVRADLLPGAVIGSAPIRTSRLADARDQFERRFVEVALARAGGNRARAARALGLSRQGLLKLMTRLHVAAS